MRHFWRDNIVLLSVYTLLLVGMVALLWLVPDRGELHLMMNGLRPCEAGWCGAPHGWHNAWCDGFFRLWSSLAEWPLYVIGLLPLLSLVPALRERSKRRGITWHLTALFAAAEVLSALVVQAIKWTLQTPRPVTYLADNEAFRRIVVEGVRLREWCSMPSGHTATFFVFFTLLSLWYSAHGAGRTHVGGHIAAVLCMVMAILGGYSRIWLSQHFLVDVCAGSVIGFVAACLVYICASRFCKVRNSKIRQ